MAYTNGIITAPVSIYDVQRAVPVTLSAIVNGTTVYSSSNDLGILCGSKVGDTVVGKYTDPQTGTVYNNITWTVISRTPINIWAKYKPVDNTELHYMGQWDEYALPPFWKTPGSPRFTPYTEWWKGKGSNWKFGLEPFSAGGSPNIALQTLMAKYNDASDPMNGWVYHGPTGGSNSPHRLTDFAGYNHHAPGLADGFTVDPLIATNGIVRVIVSMAFSQDDGTNITPANIMGNGTWYFGVVLAKVLGNTETIKARITGEANTNFIHTTTDEVAEGDTCKIYPFFSLQPELQATTQNTYYTIPLLSPITSKVQNQSAEFNVTINAEYTDNTRKIVRITITTASNASYPNCYFTLDRVNSVVDREKVTLSGTAPNWTCRLTDSRKSVESNNLFNLAVGTTHTITVNNLDSSQDVKYKGTLYCQQTGYSKMFYVRDVIHLEE